MIIDADCHISSQKFDGLAILAGELIDALDRAGVDKALVWLKPPYDKNIEPENQAVYDSQPGVPGQASSPSAGPTRAWERIALARSSSSVLKNTVFTGSSLTAPRTIM